ncbi:MAG: HIT domain-containing protein [Alphaproteobacteria bacterium]
MSYDKNNIFAKIIRGDLPAQKIYEDENILAFNDISKASPVHVLVVPKGEFIDFNDFVTNADEKIINDFFKKISLLSKQLNIVDEGFRLITNNGSNAHQTVKHFHVHLLAGKKLGPLISSDNLNR